MRQLYRVSGRRVWLRGDNRSLALAANVAIGLCIGRVTGAQVTPTINDFTVAGVRVIHKPVTANEVIGVQLFIKGGSAALTPATAGIEQLIADLGPRGTAKYDKDAFSARATATGISIRGEARKEFTLETLRAVRQHWDEAWDLFTQSCLHPTFPQAEVEQARAQLAFALRQRTDVPDTNLARLSDSVFFAGHPYVVDSRGTPEVVEKLTREDLARWHQRRLTRENLLLVVVGNVTREDLTRKVEAAFGTLPARGGAASAVPGLAPGAPSVTVVQRELPTNYIMGVYVAPGRSSPDFPAFQLAARILGEQLFEEVRIKRNLTYNVGSRLEAGRIGRGILNVSAVDPNTTVKVMFTEVRRMQRQAVSRERLGETMNTYTTGYWLTQGTNVGQAEELGIWELTGGGWRNALTVVRRFKAVTPADVQRVSIRYLKGARFIVIGDPKKIDRKLLSSM